LNFAKLTALGRLFNNENRSNFEVCPSKIKMSRNFPPKNSKNKSKFSFHFILTTIGRCKYDSALGRQTEIDS